MNLINGNQIVERSWMNYKYEYPTSSHQTLCCFVRVGDIYAEISYVKKKEKTAHSIGIDTRLVVFPTSISENDLITEIHRLNMDNSVHGILVQAPLPAHAMYTSLTAFLQAKMWIVPMVTWANYAGETRRLPFLYGWYYRINQAQILKPLASVWSYLNDLIVGKPLAYCCSSLYPRQRPILLPFTHELPSHTQQANLIAAIGKPNFVLLDG